MRFVEPLSTESQQTLVEMWHNHPQHRARTRAHMILLSHDNFDRQTISRICQVDTDRVSVVFNRWQELGIVGLFDKPKSGRPRKLNEVERQRAVELVAQDPRNPHKAQAQLEKELERTMHKKTFSRSLKSMGLRWKRMRRSLKIKRDAGHFVQAQQELAQFHQQEEGGQLDVFYFDESGFNRTSSIPYGWQPKGETSGLTASWGKRHNVLGFCNRFNDFYSETTTGRVDSQRVIDCFDRFLLTLTRPTVVVLDNAKIHRSAAFKAKQAAWRAAGLTTYFLPPYSPELNLIEIVWRFVKYKWLPLTAFENDTSLASALADIFSNIGSDEYRISFV